ncbi:MAG: choice-of-anchor M domain-containing protein [Planctomycetota bacterium]
MMRPRSCAVMMAACVAGATLGDTWPIESEPFLFRFAVDQDWGGFTPIQNTHHDLSFIYHGCGNGFSHAILKVPGVLLDADTFFVPAGEASERDTSVLSSPFDFVGAEPEDDIFWVLTQNQVPGMPFLGITPENTSNSASAEIADWVPNDTRPGRDSPAPWVGFQLVEVDGPEGGQFSLFRTGTSPIPIMSTAEPEATTTGANTAYVACCSHEHYNWTFTKPGLYEITFRWTTVLELDPPDLNVDSFVDGIDLDIWLIEPTDLTCDGEADAFDLSRLMVNLMP